MSARSLGSQFERRVANRTLANDQSVVFEELFGRIPEVVEYALFSVDSLECLGLTSLSSRCGCGLERDKRTALSFVRNATNGVCGIAQFVQCSQAEGISFLRLSGSHNGERVVVSTQGLDLELRIKRLEIGAIHPCGETLL